MSRRKGLFVMVVMLAAIAAVTVGALYLAFPGQSECDRTSFSCMKPSEAAGFFAIFDVAPAFVVFSAVGALTIWRTDPEKIRERLVVLGAVATVVAAALVGLLLG
jgi:hypothetical protein